MTRAELQDAKRRLAEVMLMFADALERSAAGLLGVRKFDAELAAAKMRLLSTQDFEDPITLQRVTDSALLVRVVVDRVAEDAPSATTELSEHGVAYCQAVLGMVRGVAELRLAGRR